MDTCFGHSGTDDLRFSLLSVVGRIRKCPHGSTKPNFHIETMKEIRRISIAEGRGGSANFILTAETGRTPDVSNGCYIGACRVGAAASEEALEIWSGLKVIFWSRRGKPPEPVGSEALLSPSSRLALRDLSWCQLP